MIVDELEIIDHPVTDDDLTLYILNSLGPKFREIATPIRARETSMKFEEIHDLLVGHENDIRLLEAQSTTLLATAMVQGPSLKMFKRALANACGALQPWRMIASRPSSTVSTAVNTILLRTLKEHYLEVAKMNPPPKVSPPEPFTVVKGSLESGGPALKRSYGDEEISISVMKLTYMIPAGFEDEVNEDLNQLFLHVDISKPGQKDSLHFLCGLYPDALGIHSVQLRPNVNSSWLLGFPNKYNGPHFQDLDEKVRDALHGYIEERGINESLFPFLQAWLYVKNHRNLMQWFKSVGTFVSDGKRQASHT